MGRANTYRPSNALRLQPSISLRAFWERQNDPIVTADHFLAQRTHLLRTLQSGAGELAAPLPHLESANFFCKGPDANILGSVSQVLSSATAMQKQSQTTRR